MTVNITEKRVKIPELKIYKGDKGSETISFTMPRSVNGTDLSAKQLFFKFLRADGYSDRVEKQFTFNDDKILFDLVLDDDLTYAEGELSAQFSFEDTQDYVLHTDVFRINVLPSVSGYEVLDNNYGGYAPTLSLLARAADVYTKTETDGLIEDLNEDIENVYTKTQVDGFIAALTMNVSDSNALTAPTVTVNANDVISLGALNSLTVNDVTLDETGDSALLSFVTNLNFSMNYGADAPNVYYVGDDCEDGVFVPLSGVRYSVIFEYDGKSVYSVTDEGVTVSYSVFGFVKGV